jgi:hypothetical protein
MKIPEEIEVPAPTAWPIVLALGLTLVSAGFVTAASISFLGVGLAMAAAVGWFRDVLPWESHDCVPTVHEDAVIQTTRETVERVVASAPRASLPIEIYPISAGVKGGLAGSFAMACLAATYGVFSGNGIWYPMNLLVVGLFPEIGNTVTRMKTFSLQALIVAVPLHVLISVLVGMLYGAMLPMAPRRPILLGGFATPLLWSFLIHGSLSAINPVMNQRIDWGWFVLSQVGFGLVAGLVVARHERISTRQPAPLMVRMGIEAPGLIEEQNDEANR